jgi:hypothetical protein
MLEQYTIADLLTWMDEQTLVVNREFQRSPSIWPPAAKVYLVDTILRGRPMPKIYLRTQTNVETMRSYREVVDGQQRLMAIRGFAHDEFPLRIKDGDFIALDGKCYSDLDDETKQTFLSYLVPVEQLLNAPDLVVFDVFQRLNTYNYNLSAQELRHGKYHGEFRNAVVSASRRWAFLIDKYNIVTKRARIRMADDELMAQIFGVFVEGVVDSRQSRTDKWYKSFDQDLPEGLASRVDSTIGFISDNLPEVLETNLARTPHFLMLFAAIAHALHGIPRGDMGEDMPNQDPSALTDMPMVISNLTTLSAVLELDSDEMAGRFHPFRLASAGSTQRIRSRRVRFPFSYRALLPKPI